METLAFKPLSHQNQALRYFETSKTLSLKYLKPFGIKAKDFEAVDLKAKYLEVKCIEIFDLDLPNGFRFFRLKVFEASKHLKAFETSKAFRPQIFAWL